MYTTQMSERAAGHADASTTIKDVTARPIRTTEYQKILNFLTETINYIH